MKKGAICAGHWVLDHIKFIDYWPNLSELTTIRSEIITNGGAPFNVLVALANLEVPFPYYGIGCLGDEDATQIIFNICEKKKINTEFLHVIPGEKTSYTDVMTLKDDGRRTMFHFRGANQKFGREHVPMDALKKRNAKLFYLGHLLLLDALEKPSKKYGVQAAHLLENVRRKLGMETVLDIATETADRYQHVVVPCLPYVDHLIINELEAGYITQMTVRKEDGSLNLPILKQAASKLLELGVQKNVILHMPEGAYWLDRENPELFYPALSIPKEKFVAACGAGDAFCAGAMVGLHENYSREETLALANATAAASVQDASNSGGIKPIKQTLKLLEQYSS